MSKKSNHSQACTPWFFPSAEDSITICDPWESADFFAFMLNDIPGEFELTYLILFKDNPYIFFLLGLKGPVL
jgi:hypothetical protein